MGATYSQPGSHCVALGLMSPVCSQLGHLDAYEPLGGARGAREHYRTRFLKLKLKQNSKEGSHILEKHHLCRCRPGASTSCLLADAIHFSAAQCQFGGTFSSSSLTKRMSRSRSVFLRLHRHLLLYRQLSRRSGEFPLL